MECAKCGYCCKHLYLWDMICISWHFKEWLFKKECKHLGTVATSDWKEILHPCRKSHNKPKICKEWKCGASN